MIAIHCSQAEDADKAEEAVDAKAEDESLPQTESTADGDSEVPAAQAEDSAKEPDEPLKQENSEGKIQKVQFLICHQCQSAWAFGRPFIFY